MTENTPTTTAMLTNAIHNVSSTISDTISTKVIEDTEYVSNASTTDPTYPSYDDIETNDILFPTDEVSNDYFYDDYILEDGTQNVYDTNDFSILNNDKNCV